MTKSIKNVLLTILLAFALVFTFAGTAMINTAKANASIITVEESASCKVGDGLENSGLKFTAKIEKQAFLTLYNTYDSVDAGMIIVPNDYVAKAGGYTFDKLSALSELEGKTYSVITNDYAMDGDYYTFDASIETIKDYNYNRDFTAVAFIKIADSDASSEEGFTAFDGAYYTYSNIHSADVYEVAYSAFEDRSTVQNDDYPVALGGGLYGKLDAEEYGIIKNYLDGVVVVENNGGVLSIANNGTYYTSPYKVITNANGDSVIDGQGKTATCFTLGESRMSVSSFENGENTVSFAKSNEKVTYNQDGSVSLTAGVLGTSSSAHKYGVNENGYIGLEGDFGVGTYIETTFSASNEYIGSNLTDFGHDNMPQIVLFADEINGKDWAGKGILLSSGVDSYSGNYVNSNNYVGRYSLHGLNRMADYDSIQWGYNKTYDYPLLTQKGLKADKNAGGVKTYKYTVGTFYNKDGKLVVSVSLLLKDGNKWTEIKTDEGKSYSNIFLTTTWTATDVATMGTNIIFMAEHKGQAYQPTTTFTYSAPYFNDEIPISYIEQNPVLKKNVASFSEDGEVELKAKITSDDTNKLTGKGSSCWSDYWYYYSYQGDYGVGWYLDFEFTGINMPQLTFFAQNGTATTGYASYSTNGAGTAKTYTTNYNRKGVVVLNGLADQGDYIQVFGPDRMKADGKYGVASSDGSVLMVGKNDENGVYQMLTRSWQYANPDTKFKYSIGTFVGTDNKVWIDMYLKNLDNGTESHLQKSLGLTVDQVGMGDIIITAPLAGGFGLSADSSVSFVSLSTPYYRSSVAHNISNGATVSADGTITMYNKHAQNIAQGAGQHAQYNNYYSFAGDYGVGYYLDFKFTGYNMPQFIFFADNDPVNDPYGYASPTNYKAGSYNSTIVHRQGVVVLNGFGQDDNAFQVWGPNRWYGSNQKYGVQGSTTKLFLTYDQYPELTRKGQIENSTKEYDLTIGTHIGTDGKVWLEVILSSGGNEIYHIDQSLGLTEAEVGVGDIIILPPFGDGDGKGENPYIINNSTSSTFKIVSKPYLKGEKEKSDF